MVISMLIASPPLAPYYITNVILDLADEERSQDARTKTVTPDERHAVYTFRPKRAPTVCTLGVAPARRVRLPSENVPYRVHKRPRSAHGAGHEGLGAEANH